MIRAAEGGTLFLDEIGDLPLETQPKLLRFLDSKEIHPLGEATPQRVAVRIVAATNADLERMMKEGRFREDLYHRLNVVHFRVPPLRERRDEIAPLIERFLGRYAEEYGKSHIRMSDETLAHLLLYAWPGNVRELANTLERLMILAAGDVISAEDLPTNIQQGGGVSRGPSSLADVERLHLMRILKETGGKKMQAARLLGIDIKTLNKKIRDYHISVNPPGSSPS